MEDQLKGMMVAHAISDDMEPYWSQYGSLRSTTGHCSPSGHGAVDHNWLGATTHPIPDPPNGPIGERRTLWRTRSKKRWLYTSLMMIWNRTGPSMDP